MLTSVGLNAHQGWFVCGGGGGFCQTIYNIEGYVLRHGCGPQILDTHFHTNIKLKGAIHAFEEGVLRRFDKMPGPAVSCAAGGSIPKPEPRNLKPETRNSKPETRNPKPETTGVSSPSPRPGTFRLPC